MLEISGHTKEVISLRTLLWKLPSEDVAMANNTSIHGEGLPKQERWHLPQYNLHSALFAHVSIMAFMYKKPEIESQPSNFTTVSFFKIPLSAGKMDRPGGQIYPDAIFRLIPFHFCTDHLCYLLSSSLLYFIFRASMGKSFSPNTMEMNYVLFTNKEWLNLHNTHKLFIESIHILDLYITLNHKQTTLKHTRN